MSNHCAGPCHREMALTEKRYEGGVCLDCCLMELTKHELERVKMWAEVLGRIEAHEQARRDREMH